jgi:ATP-dependent exoDNAse (exonuclease V) alpha subunit
MLTMREIGKDGFGAKVREWNKAELVEQWRERWAEHVNQRLAELDIDARVDHRSLEKQGIGLEPQDKIGPAASRMEQSYNDNGARRIAGRMADMAKGLERDPQVESLLRNRTRELGLGKDIGRDLSRELSVSVSFERTRSIGMSL